MLMLLVIADIDAGGGAVIDLSYDVDERRVKEEKTIDNEVITTEFPFDEFDPAIYGEQGQEFLDKVEILCR